MQRHEEEPPKEHRSVRDRVRYFEGECQAEHREPTTAPDSHEERNAGAVEGRIDVDVPNSREGDYPLQLDARIDQITASQCEKADLRATDDLKTIPRDTEDINFKPPSPQADTEDIMLKPPSPQVDTENIMFKPPSSQADTEDIKFKPPSPHAEDPSQSAFSRSSAERRRRELRAEVNRAAANDSVSRNTASSLLDKIFELRDQLEEERINNRALLEKIHVARARTDQLTAELERERAKSCHLESRVLAQERQAQEVRSRVPGVKDAYDEKERKATAILKDRISQAESSLAVAENEAQELLRTKRNMERRLKETTAQLEVEKAQKDSAQEESKKADNQLRTLRSQLNEAQEKLTREEDQTRSVKRDLKAALEVRKKLQGELQSLRDYSRRAGSATSSLSGSVLSLDLGARDRGGKDPAAPINV